LKIYYEKESVRRISWTHQSFGNIGDLDGKSLEASETLVSDVYAGCNGSKHVHKRVVMGQGAYIHRLYEDRARTMDKIMEICV
jgi:hypothetical protein